MGNKVTMERDDRAVVTLTLNRPDIHNAFDAELIADLAQHLDVLSRDDTARVVVLTGAGKSFSAGADLGWMRSSAEYSEAENLADARRLADLLHALDTLDKPTVARVNGAAFGGGVGLIACCDIAVAADTAKFALSEVRLGLVPAVISPYVVAAIGARQARRYFLSGEAMEAPAAQLAGLVHIVCAAEQLDTAVQKQIELLLKGGPRAQLENKALLEEIAPGAADHETIRDSTAARIARLRTSPEGQEGLAAFLEKRKPHW